MWVEAKTLVVLGVVAALFRVVPCSAQADGEGSQPSDAYLEWTEKQAVVTGKMMRSGGRVGGWLDTRILSTERSYNYKLRATWLTPEVIRATARLAPGQELAECGRESSARRRSRSRR